ncbi:MAG: ketopantoate reductase family protein [Candidatus Promineifilaceae bacterium]
MVFEHMGEESLTNVAVIGTGAMGSLFAAQLSSNAAVTIVGSWKNQLSAIEESGLFLTDLEGNQTNHALAVGEYDSVEGPYQYAIILVKGWQTVRAAETVREILAPDGLAVTLQNGLGHFEILAALVGESHSAIGVTSEGAMIVGPGRTQHTGIGITHLGTSPATEKRLEKMARLLQRSGFETRLTADLDGLVWGKLAINSGINPLTALLQVRNGFLSTDVIARSLMCQAAEETAAVAKVQGIRLPYVNASEMIIDVAEATAANRSSMAQDIARGAPTEIESINGKVVHIAAEHGLEVTVNRVLYQLVKSQIATGDWRSEISKLPRGMRDQFRYLANQGNHP